MAACLSPTKYYEPKYNSTPAITDIEEIINYNNKIVNQLLEICYPLFNDSMGLKISLFEYYRFYKDGTCIYLSTCTKWHRYNLENYADSYMKNHLTGIINDKINYHIWDSDPEQLKKVRLKFKLKQGFTIYKHHEDSIEAWSFATASYTKGLINKYLNNLDCFYGFIYFFEEQVFDILKFHNAKKLFPINKNPFFLGEPDRSSSIHKKKKQYLETIQVKRFRLDVPEGAIYLTYREAQCIYYKSQGKTGKEIARLLKKPDGTFLKHRTVEVYLMNAKNKALGRDMSQIIDLFLKSSLANLNLGDL